MSTPAPQPDSPIDRVAPSRRPDRRAVMYQKWRSLLFLHWPVPIAALRPLVPAALDLDLWEGVAYVGLIPFAIEQARPVGPPASLALGFLETNVRTYVHLRGRGPGVYFFSLDAASRLAVAGARLGFGLPYYHARMRMRATCPADHRRGRRRRRRRRPRAPCECASRRRQDRPCRAGNRTRTRGRSRLPGSPSPRRPRT